MATHAFWLRKLGRKKQYICSTWNILELRMLRWNLQLPEENIYKQWKELKKIKDRVS